MCVRERAKSRTAQHVQPTIISIIIPWRADRQSSHALVASTTKIRTHMHAHARAQNQSPPSSDDTPSEPNRKPHNVRCDAPSRFAPRLPTATLMRLDLFRIGRRRFGHGQWLLAEPRRRRRRQIRFVEEARKQHKVAQVHGNRQFHVDRRDAARRPPDGGEKIVRPDVHRTADDHLQQLQRCDHHRNEARRLEAHRAQRIVRVHDRVYAVVHDDEPARGRRVLGVREPRVDQHGDVVVPVQEDQRLLAQHNEQRVAQLGQLGEHKQPRPEAAHAIRFDEAGEWNEVEQNDRD